MDNFASQDINSVVIDDAILCMRIKTRDEGALAALVFQHVNRVQIIIWRIIEGFADLEDVEELAQDVFLRVWYDIDQFDEARGDFRKWINMIAKYTALDFRRWASRKKLLVQSFSETPELFARDPHLEYFLYMEYEQQLRILDMALSELPGEKMQLLTWHYIEGKTYSEIAELAQCSIGTVKSRINRILAEIRLLIYRNDGSE